MLIQCKKAVKPKQSYRLSVSTQTPIRIGMEILLASIKVVLKKQLISKYEVLYLS